MGLVVGITYTIIYIRHLDRQREENLQAYLKLFAQQSAEEERLSEGTADDETGETPNDGALSLMSTTAVVSHLNEEDDAFMRRLLDFVEKNLDNSSIGVEEMAEATATSRSSLNRKMKNILGVTPADFIKEARLKKACHELAKSNRNINDIAYKCGFSDPKYFSKVFKASIGMSPSDYRMQMQE